MNKENNDIINNFLLMGDKFIPELHLWDLELKHTLLVAHLLNKNKELTNL